MPVLIEKCTFDITCPKTPWYLSISVLIEKYSFISALNVLLKTCRTSTADAELPTVLGLAWT